MYNEELKIGQKVYCTLYGGKIGYIYEISGDQSPETCKSLYGGVGVTGGSANFKIVWNNGTESYIPECLIRSSVQWRVFEEIISAEEIEEKLAFVEECERKRDEQKIKKEIEEKLLAEKLLAENPTLNRVGDHERSLKTSAKNIRKELKKFKHKFSVRSDNNSININYTNGPDIKTIREEVTNKYCIGSFNGYTDCYDYNSSVWNSLFGGAKYVFVHREIDLEI